MTQRTLRRLLSAALVCAAPALAPAAAAASTWTVDDDRAQCPGAAFTTIQSAVDQAAPWDTVVVCDGTYEEQSTPASGPESPSATGSLNGLTITKPLTIRGAGAGKVTIKPASALTTLAGATPYLRDGGGNVVTVNKQARGATDFNENFVDISGVTITSGTTYAEAGVAFFNASGAIRNSVIGPMLRAADETELLARPHGWGVVVTNHYQGASEATARREVSIESSLVTGYQSGGILFDSARGADGAPETLLRSGILSYGYVRETTVQGSGEDATIPQTGVEYHSGHRGAIARSLVTGNYYTPDPRRSVGVLLTDAETGPDPSNPLVRGFSVSGSSIGGNGYGLFNANAANDAVRLGAPAAASLGVTGTEDYWGCRSGPLVGAPSPAATPTSCQGISGPDADGAASVAVGFARPSAPPLTSVPGPTADDPAEARFAEPFGGTVTVGEPVDPVVIARDDFGVSAVDVTLDGVPVGAASTAPYEFSTGWTPGYDELDSTRTLEATVLDSAGQSTVVTVELTVVPPAGYRPLSLDTPTADAGSVLLGSSVDRTVTVTNSGSNPATLTALDVSGAGFAVAGGTCAPAATLAVAALCTVVVRFAPTAAGAASGTLSVAYDALGGGDPLVVALSGAGVAPPAREPRDPDTRTPDTRAPDTRTPDTRVPDARTPDVPAPTPPLAVPEIQANPAVAGDATVGGTLACDPGGWSGAPTSYAYQWLRDGSPIAGANGASHRLVRADLAARLACRVVAANGAGAGAAVASPAVTVSFTPVTTKTTVVRQAGPAIVTFAKRAKAADGLLPLARLVCAKAGGCRVTTTATLKLGRAAYAFKVTRTVATGRSARVAVRLSRRARTALAARRGGGTLSVRVAVRGRGASGSAASSGKAEG